MKHEFLETVMVIPYGEHSIHLMFNSRSKTYYLQFRFPAHTSTEAYDVNTPDLVDLVTRLGEMAKDFSTQLQEALAEKERIISG